ncbi:hypothetical protein UABAM_01551 [Candidatus Uabimicrobium amorphum]|uniref:Uncharacterized protein n=2 Tax=Uabimicrobium amorphum TaxID=2596890 RepID=A0A5S9IKG5_UABAM|nr:hypothetical protein UABAM_01551 [Candidatus Uabimicrobium amorphum]
MNNLELQITNLPLANDGSIKTFLYRRKLQKDFREIYNKHIEQIGVYVDAHQKAYKITIAITLENVILSLHELTRKHNIRGYQPAIGNLHQYSQKIFYATGAIPIGSYILEPTPANQQAKNFAIHCAQTNAYKHLADIIKNMRIHSDLKVNDFVTESGDIHNAFVMFIRQNELQTHLQHQNLGVVEVVIEVKVSDIEQALAKICSTHYKGDFWNAQHFENLHKYVRSQRIIAKGKGMIPTQKGHKRLRKTIYIPQWANKTILVTGESFIPKTVGTVKAKKIGLERARADGYHKLIIYIMDLPLHDNRSLRKLMEKNIVVRDNISTAIKRADVIEIQYTKQVVKIKLELYLAEIWRVVAHLYRR